MLIHGYLALQCAIVLALFLTKPLVDYYAVLCVGLSIVAARDLESPADVTWLAILCATVVAGLVLAFGLGEAVQYIPIYIAACLLLGMYGRTSRRAEEARARSDELRAELEVVNRRLRAYAEQAEESAAAQERARLARELHDAATQTVFSMNLTAEAARMAVTEDPGRVPTLLERLQELSRDALAEMRALVRELRPASVADEGLVVVLRRHAAARSRRDGLRIVVEAEGEESGSTAVREALLRVAVEALNNVVKHAGAGSARVTVRFGPSAASLAVSDDGRGFDVAVPVSADSFGLLSMRERVEALGGTLVVRSAPGAGTSVEASLPRAEEEAQP